MKKRYPKSEEYETVTALRYVQPKCSPEDFWEGLCRELERVYDLDHAVAVINGDGADWIRKGKEYFPRSIYQYDRFHISRDVSRAMRWDEGLKKEALRALRENSLRPPHRSVGEGQIQSRQKV
ncbi:MAG TPA: hypothetical protein GX507_02460 [Clostridia bacterium]|nr:hypothetical protein [Clostridia bacterium]